MALHPYLECAMIVGTHGVRGAVRLECRCNTPADLARLKTVYRLKDGQYIPMTVVHASVQKQLVLATLEGITDLDMAIPLKGTVLYASREDLRLRRGDFFIADLIGLPVRDAESGEVYGKLLEVTQPSAQQIYLVEEPSGRTFMIPVVKEFVKKITIEGENAGIDVRLIEGMRE